MPNDNLDEVVFLVEEDADDGGFVASCSRWGIHTQGNNLDELRSMVVDAVACRFDAESSKPKRIRLHFIRDEVIAA